MSRLSRNERTGLIIIAAIAFLTIGVSIWMRMRPARISTEAELPKVEVIMRYDTVAHKESGKSNTLKGKTKSVKKAKRDSLTSRKNGRKSKNGTAPAAPRTPRIEEPVPTRR